MFPITCGATVFLSPELNIYDLSSREARPPIVWSNPGPTSGVVDLRTTNVLIYSRKAPELHKLVRDAVNFIQAMSFFEIDETDDRIVDTLVNRRTKRLTTRRLRQKG